jgi:pimeloyl-ACP methyl ester carboxylesterase
MPVLTATGFDLYYERTGQGPHLLFLTGSGTTVEQSRLLTDLFAPTFDTVTFDYRGMGRSDRSPEPYGMVDLAADGLALLDELGWDAAAVVGISFGGMVAQEVAVSWPGRVNRLALLCTSPGGAGGSSYPLHELDALSAAERSARLATLIDSRFDDGWLRSHPGDRMLLQALEDRAQPLDPVRTDAARQQLEARRHHDVWGRLHHVVCPTLIACGRYDGIAPPANSRAIASRIRQSEWREYEGGHAFLVQDARAAPDVTGFLAGPTAPDGPAPARMEAAGGGRRKETHDDH